MENKEFIEKKIETNPVWYKDNQWEVLKYKSYRTVIKKRHDFFYAVIKKYITETNKNKIDVLDAGCGDGLNIEILSKIPEANILGLDYNPLRIKRVSGKYPDIKFQNGDIFKYDFQEKFDVILCSQVLEHIKEDEKVLKILANLLKEKGILILGVPNEGCLLAKIRNNLLQPSIKKTTDHVNFYTREIIIEKIINAGFEISEIMYEGFFYPHLRLNSLMMSNKIGLMVTKILQKMFISETAGYYFVLTQV